MNLYIHLLCLACKILFSVQTGIGQQEVTRHPSEGFNEPQERATENWIEDLYEMGISISNDTIFVSDETRKVAADPAHRELIYRASYTWDEANFLLEVKEYKIAFWHLFNIYVDDPDSRENVLKYLITFDRFLQADSAMIGVFYTYAFLDPKVAVIQNGIPVVQHPELIEEQQAYLKSIVQFIAAYRLKEKNISG